MRIIGGRVGEWSVVLFGLVFFVFIYPLTKPFPYSDDWIYISPLVGSGLSFDFIFSAHNDHRIPLQKVFHVYLLNITGGDFRPLVAVNVLGIAMGSYAWIIVARLLGPSSPLVEFSIPLYTLALGFNTVSWAFQFQFVSSFLFSSIAVVLWIRCIKYKLGGYWKAFSAMALLAVCGANGLLLSLILGVGLTASLIGKNRVALCSMSNLLSLLVWLTVVVALLLGFESSAASKSSGVSFEGYLNFFAGISSSWLGVSATKVDFVRLVLAFIFVLLPFWLLLKRLIADGVYTSAEFPLAVFMLGSVVILVIVTISRAASQPWWPGLELHYGFLAVGIPVSAVVITNHLAVSLARVFVLTFYMVVGVVSYSSNFSWRLSASQDEYSKSVRTASDLLSGVSGHEIAKNSIKEFYWISDERAVSSIENGISELRKLRFWNKSQ